MQELPTGTVTFLFTDIERSTRLLSELGDEYADVLAEHHRRIRDAVGRHGGIEMGTQGDGFSVVFPRAASAVAAAADAQRSLAAGPVKVRMGVHTGEPSLTDEGYVGLAVHQAARIAAAGHGGQVVVSETTCALLDGEFELRDLGEHRLKDIGATVRLFQLGRDQFPPLRSLSQGRLPVEPAPLLGRKDELDKLLHLLGTERARLVTLTGPGGIGKTSLAVAAAAELVESFEDGVGLVELAAIREPVARPCRRSPRAWAARATPPHRSINRELLLVLDNLEQAISVAATDIAALLSGLRRTSASSSRAVSRCGSPRSASSLSSRSPRRPRWSSSSGVPRVSCPGSPPTTAASRRSAGGWTAFRSPSSWQRPGSRCSLPASCSAA